MGFWTLLKDTRLTAKDRITFYNAVAAVIRSHGIPISFDWRYWEWDASSGAQELILIASDNTSCAEIVAIQYGSTVYLAVTTDWDDRLKDQQYVPKIEIVRNQIFEKIVEASFTEVGDVFFENRSYSATEAPDPSEVFELESPREAQAPPNESVKE